MKGALSGSARFNARTFCVVMFLLAIGAASTNLMAIPAFARKYKTSCQTCHTVFPNLTPFGEAFRLNGYRFPGGTDAEVSKDNPVEMGAEGYKKLWPKSVWPGDIPGIPPFAMVVESEIANDRTEHMTSFNGLSGEVALLSGGTYGEHMSFYGEVEFAREDAEIATNIERVNVQFRPFSSTAFQFKVGSFEPGLLLVSNHRRLTDHSYFPLSMTAGDNGWAPEPYQQGVEFFGVASHRLLYNAGLVEGSGNADNNAKDYYGRVAYKFGGLALDGSTPGGAQASLPANPKPWSEKSVTVSAFVYKGSPLLSQTTTTFETDPTCGTLPCPVIAVDTTLSQEDKFTMFGGDVAWNYQDLMFHAGVTSRTDRRPFLADPADTDVKVKSRFGEVDWVAYPWLVPAARWESFDVGGEKTERASLTVNFLIRANVKGFLAADSLKEDGSGYKTEEIVGGVVFGF